MGFVADAVEDFAGDVIDAVGDVVESVGDVVQEAAEVVVDTVQAVIEDPLPTLVAMAGQAVGIPAPITMAAVTAAKGGDLQDIVLSAGTAYAAPVVSNAISSTLSSTIGDAIINETVSDAVVTGVSRGLVNGTIAESRGGDFEDGFAGAFTGTVVAAGVGELTNFVREDIVTTLNDVGISTDVANSVVTAGGRAIAAGTTAEITGRSDFDTAFTNSVVDSAASGVANFATNSIVSQFQDVAREEGDRDDNQIKTDLADAYINGDLDTVNSILTSNQVTADDVRTMFDLTDEDMAELDGLSFYEGDTSATTTLNNMDTGESIGTGAGINSTLVDEVQVWLDTGGEDTGDVSDVDLGDNFASDDLAGTESISTVSGSQTPGTSSSTQDTLGYVSDYTAPTQDVSDILQSVTPDVGTFDEQGQPAVDVAGGLNQASPGGLNFKLPSIAPAATGALNQVIRQGITRSLRGTPMRPMMRAPRPAQRPPQVAPRPPRPPARPPARPAAPPSALQAAAPVAPRKVDVKTLSPVKNIAGLSSLVGKK